MNIDISFLSYIEGNTLKVKLKNLKRFISDIENLLEKTEMLDINFDIWSHGKLTSKEINHLCNRVAIGPTCGCCADAPLEAYPFLEIHGFKVFSKPSSFTIGELCYTGGSKEWKNWENELRKNKISENVINQIKDYFENNQPEAYD